MTEEINSTGESGAVYKFNLYPIGTNFKKVAGVYLFLKNSGQGNWDVVYVGQTSDFNQRLNTAFESHNARDCIVSKKATHVATHRVSDGERARLDVERDIINSHNPPCNLQ